MFYKLNGLPEENEIVLCKVTKIYPNSVFVELMEYGRSGMIHISEVSPGRIRNLRDYVSEGRQIVCKVLRLDREKGHIDLSLRRVNSTARREKLDEIKQELKAESLVKNLAKKLKKDPFKLYKEISSKIMKEYDYIYQGFKDAASRDVDLVKLGIDKKLAKELEESIEDKFKRKKIVIQGEIKIQTYDSEGVERIKSTLTTIEKISPTIEIFYLGAGRYKLKIEDFEYKTAEKTLKKIEEKLEKFNDKLSKASFDRDKD